MSLNCHATFSRNIYRERRKGRKSKPYTIAIHPEMTECITERVKTTHPDAFLFVNPRTAAAYTQKAVILVWRRMREKAGISDVIKLYGASRHSLVSQLINLGVSSAKISRLTGHSNSRMVEERYGHHDLESLRTDLSLMSLKKGQTVTGLSLRKKDDEKAL
jgi:integrase